MTIQKQLKNKIMKTATLNIAKSLTVVTNNSAYMTNLSNIVLEADKFDVVNLNGITKTKILNKYLILLASKGYKIISENWNRVDEIAKGASDFSITLSK